MYIYTHTHTYLKIVQRRDPNQPPFPPHLNQLVPATNSSLIYRNYHRIASKIEFKIA